MKNDLQSIPGIGPRVAKLLNEVGIRGVSDLRKRNPERLYQRLCQRRKQRIDRCVLYAFRCAVYFASEKTPDPERLKWWNWKDASSYRKKRDRGQ